MREALRTPHSRIGRRLAGPAMLTLVAIALGAAGCSSGPDASATATSVTATSITATQSVTTSAGVTLRAKRSRSFALAKQKWLEGATVSASEQGLYWRAAATALRQGIKVAGADTSGYRVAIGALQDLASLPDANDTPTQIAASRHDILVLDRFFETADPYD